MSEKYTLMKLLEEYEIRIPIIQRDYAQGRDTEKAKEVRKNLIRDFKNCLSEGGNNIDFNFIYGTVSGKVFYPVDGQQRLTTLYLLHWYLSCNQEDLKKELKSFSYMTRNSASEFFSILKSPSDALIEIAKKTITFKEAVVEEAWFQIEWLYDPTVLAALNFLDDLSKDPDFRTNAKSYFTRLEGDAITFSFIPEQANDAETNAAKSYIRMNARGKTLEPFENLKAMIDSIDSKLDKATDIISEYDKRYINELFSSQVASDLNKKTKSINAMSINCLKNIYNLCAQLKKLDCVAEEYSFISKIYEDSQYSTLDKAFYTMYFNCIKAVFNYYCENIEDEYIKDVWEEREKFSATDNRKCIAAILYIYYYSKRKAEAVNKAEVEKYIYILENLKYGSWKNFLANINELSKQVAKSDDVLSHFSDDQLSGNLNITDCELDDIKVRIKEQKIKAKIIVEHKKEWNYFKELEEKNSERKIQYLLYISGYWNDYKEGNYEELCNYIAKANDYFYDNDIEWLKIYAVITNIEEDSIKLKHSEEINKNVGENKHIWKKDFYYWNDDEDNNIKNKKELENIKKAYDDLDGIKGIVDELSGDANYYDKCWLKYAVKYVDVEDERSKVLLTQELKCEDDKVYTSEDIRYDRYVLKIKEDATEGLKDFTEAAIKSRIIPADSSWTDTMYRGVKIQLEVPITISNVNESYKEKEDKCLYEFKDNIYTVYQFNENLYTYKKFQYHLTAQIKKKNNHKVWWEKELEKLKDSDFISIYKKNIVKEDCEYKRVGKSIKYTKEEEKIDFNSSVAPVEEKL